ncbi:MAG: PVC-type heme-binding CxxCH protein, partial [Phycisphaeraceae bacterium]
DGSLYAATRKEIFRLRDTNNDGVADERTSIIKLDTKGNYPHNGLGGITFDFAGHVYFGFGENLGEPYKLIGADGTTLEGGGEGGNIYSCDKNGNKLRRVATGFWNPFDMTFDAFGRLFAVDNDPDSRPPCRLLHIVEGGDYGYRFKYGRKGLHPFTSWNGEIPGTLPMVAGTGEAPSGMLAYESDNLPEEYLGTLLVTSWGDHRIERYALKPHGASFTSKMEAIVQGDQEFRPVGIALAPDGSVYFTDWVDKSYPVHNRGRIWRLSAKEEKKVVRPDAVARPELAMLSSHRPLREKGARELIRLKGADTLRNFAPDEKISLRTRAQAIVAALQLGALDELLAKQVFASGPVELRVLVAPVIGEEAIEESLDQRLAKPDTDKTEDSELGAIEFAVLRSAKEMSELSWIPTFYPNDPFLMTAGRIRLIQSPSISKYVNTPLSEKMLTSHDETGIALHWLLMLRQSGHPECRAFVGKYIEATDPLIRLVAIQWAGEAKLTQFREQLVAGLSRPDTTPRLFAATLAALDLLDGGKPQSADHVGGRWYLERMVFGEKTAPAARAMALRMLPADNPALKLDAMKKLLEAEDAKFKLEVVRTLRFSPHDGAQAMLMGIAKDEKQAGSLRAEAVIGLDANAKEARQLLMDLATGTDALLQVEALRALRGTELNDVEREFLSRFAGAHEELAEAIGLALGKGVGERPSAEDAAAWGKLLDSAKAQAVDGATPQAAGERVFFSAKAAGCYRCHTVQGRGGVTGPDLSTVGTALSRERLIESILQPSKEIAPRFSSHLIETSDGEKLTLMYVGPSPDGRQIWSDSSGKEILLQPADIVAKKPLQTSIMPADLHKAMTIREMAELLAFLESLKGDRENAK